MGSEWGNAQKRIHSCSGVREAESHGDNADVMQNAFEKIYNHCCD